VKSGVTAVLLAVCVSGCLHRSSPPRGEGVPAAPATAVGFDSTRLGLVVWYLRVEAESGAFPGAVVAVGRHGRIALLAAVGQYSVDDPRPVEVTTIYDLASLTKVIATTTACMLLVDQGKLELDAPVQQYLPEFRGAGKDRVTVRHLLTHSAGLPAWRPLYSEAGSRETALALVDTTPLVTPPGEQYVYSDLSAILLMQIVERLSGEPLDSFVTQRVFRPLGMGSTRFLPPASWRSHIAPTEADTVFRHRMLRGEVHDENAGRLGGVSGHAGLFSNAPDLARFAELMLGGGSWDTLQLIHAETIAEFTRRQNLPPGSSRALGWDTPDEPRDSASSAGMRLSPRSFGHTGFTGTSLWIDPDRDFFIILLTNRVNPTRTNNTIRRVRPHVADLVVDALTHPEL